MNKFENPFKFDEKKYKKRSLGSKLENRTQTAISGTEHGTNRNYKQKKYIEN